MRMLKMLAAGATGAMLLGTAQAAEPSYYTPMPMAHAHVELGAGIFGWDGDTYGLIEGAGRFAMPLTGNLNLEIEATGQGILWGGNDGDTLFGGYFHLFHQTPTGAYGVFGGLLDAYGPYWTFGVEGRHHVGPASVLSGQASWNFASGGYSFGHLRVDSSHYLNPNAKIGAYVDLSGIYSGGCCGAPSSFEVGLAGEKKFAASPLSIYGRVSRMAPFGDPGWAAVVGLRAFIPGSTLAAADDEVPWAVRLNPAIFD